jgi:hypothetical protein
MKRVVGMIISRLVAIQCLRYIIKLQVTDPLRVLKSQSVNITSGIPYAVKATLARDFLLQFFSPKKHPPGPLIQALNSFRI